MSRGNILRRMCSLLLLLPECPPLISLFVSLWLPYFLLHSDCPHHSHVSWYCADPAYPSRGVVIQYYNGSSTWCGGVQRSMRLELLCPSSPLSPTLSLTSGTGVSVIEVNQCTYRVQIPNLAGCPLQCVSSGTVCNNHGVCGYNADAAASQCFCYSGFSGSMCENGEASGMSTEGILLIIVCIALAAVLGFLGYIMVRMRKLNVNPTAYNELQGRCM
jgi:hypothetical protein